MTAVRTVGEAEAVAAAISHALATQPIGGDQRDALLAVRSRLRAGAWVVPPAEPGGAPDGDAWVDVTKASRVLKVSPRAVRKRLSRGALGARKIGGVWMVPRSALPEGPDPS